MARVSEVTTLVSGLTTPEGPVFDLAGNLFFVEWEKSSIARRTPRGEVSEWFNTGGIPAGLAFDKDGNLYVADEGPEIHGILRITPDKQSTILVNEYQGKPLNGANDLMFDADGVLYFSDPYGSSRDNPIGGFYRYFPDGRLEQIDTGLAFPNGLAIDAAGTAVYLAETGPNHVLRYAINRDGTTGPREIWATLSDGQGPDGMAFDARGNLYVAHWSGSEVAVFDRHGQQIESIPVPGRNVTNCAFAPDAKTLVITEVETGSIYQVELNVAGQRLYSGV